MANQTKTQLITSLPCPQADGGDKREPEKDEQSSAGFTEVELQQTRDWSRLRDGGERKRPRPGEGERRAG